MTLNVGDTAPDFTTPDQDGTPVTLSALRGKPVVLYFYPKADTPGCTTQACGVRDHRADYTKLGATVLESRPTQSSRSRSSQTSSISASRCCRTRVHAVAEAYGVWVEKSMYGRTYMGNERTTFVIDADGKISHIFRKVKPAEHDEKVLSALAE